MSKEKLIDRSEYEKWERSEGQRGGVCIHEGAASDREEQEKVLAERTATHERLTLKLTAELTNLYRVRVNGDQQWTRDFDEVSMLLIALDLVKEEYIDKVRRDMATEEGIALAKLKEFLFVIQADSDGRYVMGQPDSRYFIWTENRANALEMPWNRAKRLVEKLGPGYVARTSIGGEKKEVKPTWGV